jgi:AraC-like DNA-binding protein
VQVSTTTSPFNYSTSNVEPGKAFEYYQHSVTKHFIPAECKASKRDGFFGEVNGHQCGQLLAGRYAATHHIWNRTDQDVRTKPDDDMVALLLESGSAEMQQVGRHIVMRPGDVMLFDGARSFRHDMMPGSVLLVRIPRTLMKANISNAEKYVNFKISDGLSIQPLIAGLIREVYLRSPEANQAAKVKLANALLSTLSAALEMHSTGVIESYDSRSLFEKSLSIIDSRIDDPELTVEKIAQLLYVSERTLSRVFARQGVLASKVLWNRRLERGYKMLKERGSCQVTQVAFACGFNDLAHFSRSFKKMYGMSPSKLLA